MYTLYKFHFLNGISEINQLFDDILIWPAPVYICLNNLEEDYMFSESQIRTFIPQRYKPNRAHHTWKTPQYCRVVGALFFCDDTLWK